MSKKIKIVCLILILILICGFFVWQHYQEKKYQACIEKCMIESDFKKDDIESLLKPSYLSCVEEDCFKKYRKHLYYMRYCEILF